MEIKAEDNIYTVCSGCLCTDRAMSPCYDLSLFLSLLGEQITDMSKEVFLCWECNARLRKVRLFQNQVKTAQNAWLHYLYQVNAKPPCLSTLSVTYKDSYDEQHTHCDNPVIVVEPAQEKVKEELVVEDIWNVPNNTIPKDEDYVDTKEEYHSPYPSDIDTTESIDKPKKKKNKRNEVQINSRKRYEKYATVITTEVIHASDLSKFYERVVMSEEEIDEILDRHTKEYGHRKIPYKCEHCMKHYKRKTDYNRHCDLNHKKAPYKCSECKRVCKSESDLRTHWRRHSEMVRCVKCWEVYRSKAELRKHLTREHVKLYCCKLCDVQCSNLRKFAKHYESEHDRYICDYCQARFTAKRFLEKHIKLHLPPVCQKCRLNFKSHKALRRHAARHKPPKNVEAAYCVECDKQFPSVHKFRSHIKCSPKHTPQPKISVPCPDCGKIFTRKSYMNNHYRQVHSKTTRHYCSLCNKHLVSAYSLRNHMNHVHEKKMLPKNKICDLCGRGFSTNRILINHIRTHTGERPFKCAHCPASFAQHTAMRSHEKSQHNHNNTFTI